MPFPLLTGAYSEGTFAAGSVWNGNKNVLPDAFLEGISVGDPLDDDWINPLIYHSDPARVLSRERIPAELPVVTAVGTDWNGKTDLLNGSEGIHPEKVTSRL